MKKRNKRDNKKILPYVKYFLIILFVTAVGFIFYQNTIDYLRNTRLFFIKTIIYDPTLPFSESREITRFKGKSIFDIDVESLQTRLRSQYPQVAYLKVVKRFPDQLIVLAKKRNPVAHVLVNGRDYIVDMDGVVIPHFGDQDSQLPVIRGLRLDRDPARIGFKLKSQNLPVALKILNAYRALPFFAAYPVQRVEMENLSKIHLVIGRNLDIIVDKDRIQDKLKNLELIFTQGKLDLSTVKYIDLRFNEPVLGKK